MRFSRLPLAIGAAAIALGGLIAPTATAADLSINNDICEISFTDGEITFFQSKFKQARVDLITFLKDEIPAATAELDELQEFLEDLDLDTSERSWFDDYGVLAEKVSVKAVDSGFLNIDYGSETTSEVNVVLGFLPSFALFENLGIHYWNIYYDRDADLLRLPVTSANTVLDFMNFPFGIGAEMSDQGLDLSTRGVELVDITFAPLQDLRAPFTPVFEACANGQAGTIIGDEVEDAPGNDVPGDKQEPAGRNNSSSFGSS